MKEHENKIKYGGIIFICSKKYYDINLIKQNLNNLYGFPNKGKHSQTKEK